MNAQQIVQALVLLTQLSAQLPALLEAVKAVFSDSVTEAELKAELQRLQESNSEAYQRVVNVLGDLAK